MRQGGWPTWALGRTALRLAARRLLRRRGRGGDAARAREAEREDGRELATVLGRLRGIYTKLGQHLALRADLLSDEMRQELTSLTESAPPTPFAQVQRALERSLGPLGTRFSSIDPHPIGTASIAQVHRARLVTGRMVAVKVRHPELTPARLDKDLRRLRRALFLLRRWLPRAERARIVDELAHALREELDLEREGRIGEEIAAQLADDPRIVVPPVHWEATGPGALTVDFVPRIRLDDRLALERAGIRPEDCLAVVADAYGRMIFRHGLFHADPHPGNVFAVDEASPLAPAGSARPRILFVDFGLSKRLPAPLVEELRLGIHALLRRDVEALLAGLRRIEAVVPGRERAAEDALREVLEAGAADALAADAARIGGLKEVAKRLLRDSGAFRVPAELLLYARTLVYVLALAERMAPGVDPMPHLLRHLLRFLSERGPGDELSPVGASGAARSAG